MLSSHIQENDFLSKLTEIITAHISNEKFGVSELAAEIGMSRSNLLRKVQKLTKLSVSQFIRQVRLQAAMELLRQTSSNVSEVSFQVGFSSTSYFIKCFKDYYGYPPGEVGKRDVSESDTTQIKHLSFKKHSLISGLIFILLVISFLFVFNPFSGKNKKPEKSIAVLPFINDSNDSTNIHIVNGLMESILNNLQKIEELRVISRTSVEKYRNNPKTISEIAKELNVNYFIEGSGQKNGDEILLNVQLIEARTDKHLWAEQYSREVKDIFKLQQEVAKNIANKIEVIITPEVEERIDKIPTENLVAYEYMLKGLDLFHQGTEDGIRQALTYYKKAIDEDPEYARPYAALAIAYYFLDFGQAQKRYSEDINFYADKALLLDSQSAQSLVAKALFYMHSGENESAVPYLEKALEYNPNSAMVLNILSDFYTSYIPNTEKYLEYALKGISLDIAANDSVSASFIYLHVSNALIQSGFVEEAIDNINKSLDYNPDNLYSQYVKAYILYAKNNDLEETRNLVLEAYKKDTTRLDILQELGKLCYYLRDYESSYYYFKKFVDIKNALNLDIYRHINLEIGYVFSEMGFYEEAEEYFNDFKQYAENDKSVYKHIHLAMYHSYKGETEKALEQLELFSEEENYHYWTVLLADKDPVMDNIKQLPEFKKIWGDIERKFSKRHNQIRQSLEEKGVI